MRPEKSVLLMPVRLFPFRSLKDKTQKTADQRTGSKLCELEGSAVSNSSKLQSFIHNVDIITLKEHQIAKSNTCIAGFGRTELRDRRHDDCETFRGSWEHLEE